MKSVYWEEFLDSFVSASEQAPSVENKQNKVLKISKLAAKIT